MPSSKPSIKHIVTLGDSLSDRGTMNKRHIFGVLSASGLAGLKGHSPRGRFTNGLVWTDYLAAMMADDFIQQEDQDELFYKGSLPGHQHFLSAKEYVAKLGDHAINLDDDLRITYQGHDFFRTFDEGGLTAKSYFGRASYSISRFFTRLVVAVLGEKRQRLFNDDGAHDVSDTHKQETLVMEWSGANDLITVNDHPSEQEARDAVRARIDNIKKMIAQGYKNFMVFNMPDLSKTPRFAKYEKTDHRRTRAQRVSKYFNQQLQAEIDKLKLQYAEKGCHFDIFDAETQLNEAYENPAKYGFQPAMRTKPYVNSEAFKTSKDHITDSQGHMFWDDVHPTTHLHRILAIRAYQQFHQNYQVDVPTKTFQDEAEHQSASELLQVFKHAYLRKFHHDKHSLGSTFRRSRILTKLNQGSLTLKELFEHALVDGGDRSRQVLQDINWIDSHGKLKLNNTHLQEAHGPAYTKYLQQQLIHAEAMAHAMIMRH